MMKKTSFVPSLAKVRLPAEMASKYSRIALATGGLGLVASGIGLATEREQFFHSYLVAFMFLLSLGLGCMFFTLIQHVTGARWSVVIRRIAETLMGHLWLIALFLIPIFFGLHDLYHWTHGEAVASDHLLQHKQPYLNQTFFMIRMAVYLLVWVGVGHFFYRRSVAMDESRDVGTLEQLRKLSAPALLLYALSQTFASFDLLMSLDPHWYSTIFGVYFFAGTVVSTFAVLVVAALLLRAAGMFEYQITTEHFHDLGKLMFGFTVFWAYIAFSQFFLIWYGNIPEETVFYAHRWEGSWKSLSLLLLAGRFVIPFFVLLSQHAKRNPWVLGGTAVWVLFMQFIDLQWLVLPSLHHEGYHFHWLDLTCLVGLAGVFASRIISQFGRHAAMAIGDPMLEHSLEFENG